jgi:hypothetical protein
VLLASCGARVAALLQTVDASATCAHTLSCAAQIKQRGSPDPGMPFGPGQRSACSLPDGETAPLFWDDAALPRQVVVRLVDDEAGSWQWSGGFEPQEKEDYFGVRMLHASDNGERDGLSVIVPVSITVRASGVVVVTFKAKESLPPYRIHNACSNVDIVIAQDIEACPLLVPLLP